MALRTAPTRRKRLSMTSLIDVIFLLLLFFMLTSTFTKYGEIELQAAGGGAAAAAGDTERLFLTLRATGALLNGTPIALDDLRARLEQAGEGAERVLLISLGTDTSAQDLVDVLAMARGLAGLTPVVLR